MDKTLQVINWAPGGRVNGRYLITSVLDRGGMGLVAIADDLFLRKQVALKALLPHLIRNPAHVELFFKEVAIAHTITHPGISRTFDLGEENGIYFFSMEYIEGQSLEDKLTRMGGKLPVDEVRDIALALCDALDAAHKVGVVHRDLTPSNIMLVDDARRAVIMDFGISGFSGSTIEQVDLERDVTVRSSWTATSAGLGTPIYMSPEQWNKRPCSPETDLYSLSVILFQCLVGRPPFEGSTVVDVLHAHITQEPPRLRSMNPSLPKDFDEVIARCLRKCPEERVCSAGQMAEMLRPGRVWLQFMEWSGRALVLGVLLGLIGYGVYAFSRANMIREMRPALHCLAQLTATQIDSRDLDMVDGDEDLELTAFERVQKTLQRMVEQYPQIYHIYTVRATDEVGHWTYVVDEKPLAHDANDNGVIDEGEQGARPGVPWSSKNYPSAWRALVHGTPTANSEFIRKEGWGVLLSGYARIGQYGGPGGYIVGVDVNHKKMMEFRNILIIIFSLAWVCLLFLPRMVVVWLRRRRQSRDSRAGRFAFERRYGHAGSAGQSSWPQRRG